jgi:hypothetical protein
MLDFYRWQTGPALLVSFGLITSAIAPLTNAATAQASPTPQTVAQLFPGSGSNQLVAIPAGTRIPVRYDQAEKIVVAPNETLPLTLVVSKNIRSASGQLLIPAWSEVRGRLEPVQGGSQFVAEELVLTNGTRYFLNASSDVVTTTQEVRPGIDTNSVLKGAAIGAGAATILSGVTGRRRITLGKILIGAGVGAAGGAVLGKKREQVIVVNPDRDLTLTLNSRLALR